jgi:hypothetical protein
MSNHVLLKRLQILTDKLELRRDDIAVGEAALADESRELASRQEQLNTVNEQVASAVREMDQLGVEGRAEKARRDEFSHEEEALRHTFTTILDQGIKGLREERKRQLAAAVAAEAAETELREVSVLFEDEEAVFRITDATYTFDELTSDACRFFELHPLDVVIMDDHDEPWPGDASVRGQMSQFDNAYGRIVLKFRQTEMEDERPEDADNLLQLLLNVRRLPPRHAQRAPCGRAAVRPCRRACTAAEPIAERPLLRAVRPCRRTCVAAESIAARACRADGGGG